MNLKTLREEVLEANLELLRRGLVLYTFGNASGIDRAEGLVIIKPSGVPYERMKPEDLVVVKLDGSIVEGTLRPSSDLPTHLVLYKSFPTIGGVAHTHSSRGNSLGTGSTRNPLVWHHTCRLFSWTRSFDKTVKDGRDSRCLRAEHGSRHSSAISQA